MGLDSPPDGFAEAAGSDEDADGGDADRSHEGDADSIEQVRQGQGKLDPPEILPAVHAHADRRFPDGGVDPGQAGMRGEYDGEQRIEE